MILNNRPGVYEAMLTTKSIIIFLLIISALITTFTLVVVFARRKNIRGSIPLHIFLLAVITWDITYTFHWLAQGPAEKAFWLDMTYLGVVSVPASMLVFIISYLGKERWLTWRRVVLLIAEPLITLTLLWTDPMHGLFYGGYRYPMQSQILEGGFWFWVNVTYQYAIILLVIIFTLQAVWKRSPLFHRQALWISVGLSFPIAANIATFLGINPLPGVDLTPISFSFTGVIISAAVIFHGLFDLIPISRDVLVETMPDGLLLLDNNMRVIDVNPAARHILKLPDERLIGLPVKYVLSFIPGLDELFSENGPGRIELMIPEPERYIQMSSERLNHHPSGLAGQLLICRDITEQKNNELRLREQYTEIAALKESLSEQAIRDPLTGMYNRRYLYETLPREIARSERADSPMCVVILDMDNFKSINDTFGHTAGDHVLVELSRYLEKNTRQGDMVVRYGGEEFLISLSNTPADAAYLRVEGWLTHFATTIIPYGGAQIISTFSAGIAVYPEDGLTAEQLINQADSLLYQAKEAGKCRIKLEHEIRST